MSACTVPFYKLSPGGNPTILVWDNSLLHLGGTPEKRAAIARSLMDPDNLGAEQVGFLDTSRALPHMEMMGGEFCINAIRSAALVFDVLGLLPETSISGIHEGHMTTSGVNEPIRVRVCSADTATMSASMAREVALSLSLAPNAQTEAVQECAPGQSLVQLPGITHLLLDATRHPVPEALLAAAEAKRAEYGLDSKEAAGVIWYLPGSDGTVSIIPVVHVAATGSSVAETACGSGSLALALMLAQSGKQAVAVHQPSGHAISITFESPSSPTSPLTAWISGIVRLTAEGKAYLH